MEQYPASFHARIFTITKLLSDETTISAILSSIKHWMHGDNASGYSMAKRSGGLEQLSNDIRRNFLNNCQEKFTGDKESKLYAYIGISTREDYQSQFDIVVSEVAKRGYPALVHKTIQKAAQNQAEKQLSQFLLDASKHICLELQIYSHLVEKTEPNKLILEVEIARIIRPSFFALKSRASCLLTYASMQPTDYLMTKLFNLRGSQTITMQHGLYVEYNKIDTINRINYTLQPASHMLAWGSYSIALMKKYNPRTIFHDCGRPIRYVQRESAENLYRIVVCLDQKIFENENHEMISVVKKVCDQPGSKYSFSLRLHPQLNKKSYTDNFPKVNLQENLNQAWAVIGHTTTMIHEAAMSAIPTFKFISKAECVPFPSKYSFKTAEELKNLLAIIEDKRYNYDFTNCFFSKQGQDSIDCHAKAIIHILCSEILHASKINYDYRRNMVSLGHMYLSWQTDNEDSNDSNVNNFENQERDIMISTQFKASESDDASLALQEAFKVSQTSFISQVRPKSIQETIGLARISDYPINYRFKERKDLRIIFQSNYLSNSFIQNAIGCKPIDYTKRTSLINPETSILISIVTVTYNDLNALQNTIESFRAFKAINNFVAFEYLVIDGGSNDGTACFLKTCSEWVSEYISEPDNGIYDAMNKGILRAKGRYTWFMNAGDLFISNHFNLLNLLRSSSGKDIDAIYGSRIYVKSPGNIEEIQEPRDLKEISSGMCFGHQAMLCKTSVLRRYMFNDRLKFAADYEQIIRMHLDGIQFCYSSELFCKFQSGGASESGLGPHLEAVYVQWLYFGKSIDRSRYLPGLTKLLRRMSGV
jgi:hypothetical protein